LREIEHSGVKEQAGLLLNIYLLTVQPRGQYYEVALTPAFEASFCHATGAIGCVSLVEKRVLNAGSDGGNQCSGAN
jgi:hypothetical protein